MGCGKRLKWYENVPIFSWLALRGRCAKCKKKIGVAEILAEVLMVAGFVGAYAAVGWTWRLPVVLVLLVVLGVLAVYDGKWGELPTGLLATAVLLAVGVLLLGGKISWLSLAAAVGLSAGIYLLANLFSKGKLCGDGDWVLGLAIGVALGKWWLALICLALSNLLAAVFAVVARRKKVYFGPFFVIGFGVVFSLQEVLCLTMCLI